jgi:hypothetical protein
VAQVLSRYNQVVEITYDLRKSVHGTIRTGTIIRLKVQLVRG